MRFIISPAKKMRMDDDGMECRGLPVFLEQTQLLMNRLREMDGAELQALWKCNDKIAALNMERLRSMNLRASLTPAVLAYEGIQYQYMAPAVFTDAQCEYIHEHLRILSGFYGLLRPFDGVVPYRLEMQARLSVDGARDLYDFWGDRLAKALCSETDCIINLASKEYSSAVAPHLPSGFRQITCVFGEERQGKVVEKGTLCKKARGEMVRFAAEKRVSRPEELQRFTGQHYCFSPKHSDESSYVFLLR